MAIWIRSQDKTSLIGCKTIDVLNRFNEFHIVANYIDFGEAENYDDLGQYSSEGEQIKVLDMIQNHVETYSNKVYQMPQDNEVEV